MISTSLRMAGGAVLFALVSLRPSIAAVEPGVEYPAGTMIDTPGTGVEFTIPQGWSGILPQGGTFFVLGSPEQRAYIFVMTGTKTVDEAKEMMARPLPLGNGLILQPAGKLHLEGEETLSGNYTVEGAKQPLTGYVWTRVSDGIGVTYVAISAPDTAAGVQDVVQKLSQETVLEQP